MFAGRKYSTRASTALHGSPVDMGSRPIVPSLPMASICWMVCFPKTKKKIDFLPPSFLCLPSSHLVSSHPIPSIPPCTSFVNTYIIPFTLLVHPLSHSAPCIKPTNQPNKKQRHHPPPFCLISLRLTTNKRTVEPHSQFHHPPIFLYNQKKVTIILQAPPGTTLLLFPSLLSHQPTFLHVPHTHT